MFVAVSVQDAMTITLLVSVKLALVVDFAIQYAFVEAVSDKGRGKMSSARVILSANARRATERKR